MLLKDFAGSSLSLEALCQEHSTGKCYLLKNYQDVLRKLEREGKIRVEPPAEHRRMSKIKGEVTFSVKVKVAFPGIHNYGHEVLYRVDRGHLESINGLHQNQPRM